MAERDIKLSHQQSSEMESIIHLINTKHQEDLDKAITEQDPSTQQLLKKCWEIDSEKRQMSDTKHFFEDQLKNKNGNRGNSWSSITYRLALAVYTRSKSAYDALKGFGILQLPSIKSLQNKSSRYLDSSGVNQKFLEDQAKLYRSFQEEKRLKGETVPNNVGVLIFDEVKVIDKVIWNSKNHEFVGLAMSPEEFPSLFDIYSGKSASSTTPKPTKYILQFLWRDLSSNFDVIGPYYTSETPLEHKFVMGCLLETMRCFHSYNFRINAIVCDGASENLALIKETVGHTGVFGYKKLNGNLNFDVTAHFQNPWEPNMKVHWIICPSHQMKNMISALHSSRDRGSKRFKVSDVFFGWKDIEQMKKREDERYRNGQLRYEPSLLNSYVERDAWTRLNVKPSKIFQQENILSELFDYGHSVAHDSASALQCYKYLRACNQIFENGFMSKRAVRSIQAAEIASILRGYSYFERWIRNILEEDENYNPNKATQRTFLSWQTWDLLRVCVFGVQSLVEDFTGRYPHHFLVLSRINGSAVESLFSQFKYATGSKLSAVNYNTARKAVILKSNIHGKHSNGKDYRDAPLYIRETDI